MMDYFNDFIELYPTSIPPHTDRWESRENEWRDERVWHVRNPGMFPFYAPREEKKNVAVVICPGGAYRKLNPIYEGLQYARWFSWIGVDAFVLLSRLPNQPELNQKNRHAVPYIDMRRAIDLVSSTGNYDAVGGLGFSAGGHLVGTVSRNLDFTVMVSSVVTMKLPWTHEGSRDNLLGEDMTWDLVNLYSLEEQSFEGSKVMIVHAQDDQKANVMNAHLLYENLIKQKVPTALHIFPTGGHPPAFGKWRTLLNDWLVENKFLK